MTIPFSVAYIGQARYIECIEYHNYVIQGVDEIYGSLSHEVVELWGLPSKVTNSVNGNISTDEILKKMQSLLTFKKIKILDSADYSQIDDPTSISFYPCNLFFTISQLPLISSDYLVCLTTDLIFLNQNNTIQNMLKQIPNVETPTCWAVNFDNELISTFQIYLNRQAQQKILNNWKSAIKIYLDENHQHRLKNEYATYRLLKLCGIEIRKMNLNDGVIRLRPNMNFNDFINNNFQDFLIKSKEYSLDKAERVRQRWQQSK